MPDLIGRSLGRYHILEQLGEGGMATVFRAYDTRLERDAAVKVIRRDVFPPNQLENILKRFEREAKALARLAHPNIVSVIDFGEEDGTPYLVMVYLPGGTLKQRLGKPISWQESVRLLLPVARALQYAHSQKIAHRDVKPSNILISYSGEPMLTDFGIAKILEGAEGQTLTGTGVGVGTPEYMAPEQWTGHSGPLSDIYSLGVVLYEMVTGRKPYVADTPAAVLLKQVTDPLPRPSQFVPSLPEGVERLILKALAKNPEDRYQDMGAMVAALENLISVGADSKLPEKATTPAQAPLPVKELPTAIAQQPAYETEERAAKEKADKEAAQREAAQKAEHEAVELAARKKAEREAVERAEREAIELAERRKAEREIAEKAKQAEPGKTGIPPEGQKPKKKISLKGIVILSIIGVSFIGASIGVIYLLTRPPITPPPTQPSPTQPPATEKVQIRWFVGLGPGTDAAQIEVEQALVDKFNVTHDNIQLVLEVHPSDSARDVLETQIASGQGPDIIGPVGRGGTNAVYGQWLDLSPYMGGFDTSVYNPALIDMYRSEEGQLGLPFLIYPGAVWYMPRKFEEAGLNMPPTKWGGNYIMPDGTEVAWDYITFATVARMLTLDIHGNNALSANFDKTQIVQYGFHPAWSGHPAYLGAYHGTPKFFAGSAGNYTAAIPDSWKEAWKWYYDGMWGDQPFIPIAAVSDGPEFNSSNTFSSGKIAMTITNIWYTCCLADFAAAGNEFQFAPIPKGIDGMPHTRVDADTFHIWKGTAHPAEAFEVLTYLIGPTGTEYLAVPGTTGPNATYGGYGFPALPDYQQWFLEAKRTQYPFVTTWDVILAGQAYPDVPSADSYQPNWEEAWARLQTFGDLMENNRGLDLAHEIAILENDLTIIYNK